MPRYLPSPSDPKAPQVTMHFFSRMSVSAAFIAAGLLAQMIPSTAQAATRIEGQVQIGGGALAGSTVSLWAASADAPARLAQVQSDADGRFVVSVDATPSGVSSLYLVASGGTPAVSKAGGDNKGIDLLAVLGNDPPPKVVVNELTTVASAFTNARFIKGESISGNPLGLKIAAGNVPNLIDPATGGWGKVILDPLNSTQTTTLANLDTLGSLIAAFATVANEDWRLRFLKATTATGGVTPKNTLEAMAGIAREPWAAPKDLYTLFDEAYPQPKDGSRRAAPFVPYLSFARRLRPIARLRRRRDVRQWPVYVRRRWQLVEWAKLDARFTVRRAAQHRRRGPQDDPQRNAAFAADHRFHGDGDRRGRLGHRRDARQGLDHQLQRQNPDYGF
jgi:hypothetical protein